jgi:hypothetical protein
VEARQEFFYQEYNGLDAEGSEFMYQQHTNYRSYGLFAGADLFSIKKFDLFGQLYVGANSVGPIGRMMFGIEYNPNSAYSFIFGLEGSSLMFYHQNNYFLSNKLGLHYGIKFNL